MSEYKLVLGLEIHLHLRTNTKMFCRCSADIYESEPNTHTCPVCLGLPGALPVPNEDAVRKTQLLGLALNCSLNENSRFDRKHYSYPDLPKGYQISQYKEPLCENGFLELSSGEKADIERIHLEEDTAKSKHSGKNSLIDFNKSGMPLVEIVTHPTFKSIEDAVEFSRKVQDVIRVLNIGDGDMEKGQMRLEANISMRTPEMERNEELPSYKVEIKNINSFRFMERAVKAEIKRQTEILQKGETPEQENRGYDENKDITVSQRSKEEAHDYRYFPEPDIPPMVFEQEYFEELETSLPELPWDLKTRLMQQYELSEKNSEYFSNGMGLSLIKHFEEIASLNIDPEKAANLLINRADYQGLTAEEFVEKFEQENQKLDNTDELSAVIEEVISENNSEVGRYKQGEEMLIKFFIGQVMKKTQGKADPQITKELLEKHL